MLDLTRHMQMRAFSRTLRLGRYVSGLGAHPGFVGSEWFEPGLGAAFVKSCRILDRCGSNFPPAAVNWVPCSWGCPALTRILSSR